LWIHKYQRQLSKHDIVITKDVIVDKLSLWVLFCSYKSAFYNNAIRILTRVLLNIAFQFYK
nr:hypothetical protein [Candidatus Cloacimonadota bacterium]